MKKKTTTKKFLIGAIIIGGVIVLFGLSSYGMSAYFGEVFLPNTYIAGFDVSGMTKDKAEKVLNEQVGKFNEKVVISGGDYSKEVSAQDIGIDVESRKTVEEAFRKTHPESNFGGFLQQLTIITDGIDLPAEYVFEHERFDNFMENELRPLTVDAEPLKYELLEDDFNVIEEKIGHRVNETLFAAKINESARKLEPIDIELDFINDNSPVTMDEMLLARGEALMAESKPFKLTFEDKEYEITDFFINKWIIFEPKETERKLSWTEYLKKDNLDLDRFILGGLGINELLEPRYDYELKLTLDPELVSKYFTEIGKEINIRPVNAKFQMKEDGTLEIIADSEKGREIQFEKNYNNLVAKITSSTDRTMPLDIKEVGADVSADNIDELGIKELVATGTSNFSGSPSNRRHNIRVAADKLNGLLIKPGEEFSFNTNIGDVNAATGYLPELVIKDNKTIPEYGGGMCQISTTTFRLAMNAGLEVTERKNHSYAVSYYAPQGTDATVYMPSPDLKFINDTPGYLLLQTSISGNTLKFEFFGTKDAREVVLDGPHTWDHKGDGSFRARWTQTVKLPNGEERVKTFTSFYDNPDKYHENEEEPEEEDKEEEKPTETPVEPEKPTEPETKEKEKTTTEKKEEIETKEESEEKEGN